MAEFSQEIFDTICDRLADGESLRSICSDDGMPTKSNVFRWLTGHPERADQYARAREAQADALFDDVLSIADDARNDWMEQHGEDDVGYKVNGEHIQRSRLRIDARKWMAGKLRPKVYGEKIAIGGADDLPPVQTEEVGAGQAKLVAFLNGIAERSGEAG